MLTFLVCKKEEEDRWYWTLVDEPPEPQPQPGESLRADNLPPLAHSAESYETEEACEAVVNRIKAEAPQARIKRGYYQGKG